MTATQADLDAILRRILETPDDDAPRLVYSDALEEMGYEQWAGFIRGQIRNEKLPWYDAPNRHLQDPMWAEIVRGAGYWHDFVRFERGFVNEVLLTCDQFMKHAQELFSQYPITSVTLTDKLPNLGRSNGVHCGIFVWGSGDGPWQVPRKLFQFFDDPKMEIIGKQCFGLDGARLALSIACVRYGRSLVGLPPILQPIAQNVPLP